MERKTKFTGIYDDDGKQYQLVDSIYQFNEKQELAKDGEYYIDSKMARFKIRELINYIGELEDKLEQGE